MFSKLNITWGSVLGLLIMLIAVNFLIDAAITVFGVPELGTAISRPFTWIKSKISPPATSGT